MKLVKLKSSYTVLSKYGHTYALRFTRSNMDNYFKISTALYELTNTSGAYMQDTPWCRKNSSNGKVYWICAMDKKLLLTALLKI